MSIPTHKAIYYGKVYELDGLYPSYSFRDEDASDR